MGWPASVPTCAGVGWPATGAITAPPRPPWSRARARPGCLHWACFGVAGRRLRWETRWSPMAKDLDTSNPYDEEFREEWQEGDPSVEWIRSQMGTYCRMTLGGVKGLYRVTGISEASGRVVIEGRRKPDHD